jgi:DNA-binding protein HU-beta
MTRKDLLDKVSKRVDLPRYDVEDVLDAITAEILNSLIDGEKVFLKNFITFEITQRPERRGKHPQTGEPFVFPPVKSIKCKISQTFKDAINGKRD